MQIGSSGASTGNLDTANVHQATDVFVDTRAHEVYAADGYGNKRVIVFDSETGKFKRMWGAFGNPPPPTFAANVPTPQPQTTPEGPPEFGLPHAIKVSRDGVVYVADRINNRIQMFTRDGKFLKQVRVTNEGSDVVPVPAGFAFSPDAKQQFLYVVDSGPMRVVIFDRQSMTQMASWARRARTRANSTSCTIWRPTRRATSIRQRSSTTGAPRNSCLWERGSYSTRSALSGSAFAACRAGITHASIAIAVSTSTTTAIVKGSVAVTP